MNKRYVFLAIIVVFFAVIYSLSFYDSIINWFAADALKGNYKRGIGTNFDLWKNGYLGVFFRFEMFGFLTWLTIPFGVYFVITIKKREKWEKALFLSLFISTVFICVMGYKNFRYQLSIIPLYIFFIFFILSGIARVNKKIFISLSSGIIVLIFISLLFHKGKYVYCYNLGVGNPVNGSSFPYKVIEYIEKNIDHNSIIKENNVPLLYYHTDKKSKGIGKVNNKYLLVRGPILDRYELAVEDQNYRLYKINNLYNRKKILTSIKGKSPDFEADFSKCDLSLGGALCPKVLGQRNSFIFSFVKNNLKISWKNEKTGIDPILLLGYDNIQELVKMDLKNGGRIFLEIEVNSGSREDKSISVFIQDKVGYWSRKEQAFVKRLGRKIFVTKKIRPQTEHINLGLIWKPTFEDDFIEIMSFKIYIENEEKLN